jgi:hypothetical protein
MRVSFHILVSFGANHAEDVAPFLAIPELRAAGHAPGAEGEVVLLGGAGADWAVRLAESKGCLVTIVPGQWAAAATLAHFAGRATKLYLLPGADAAPFAAAASSGYASFTFAPDTKSWQLTP